MRIKDLAAKAKEMLHGGRPAIDEEADSLRKKHENMPGDRFSQHPGHSPETSNERLDDFTTGETYGKNREAGDI